MKFAQRLVLGYIRTKFKLLSTISKKQAAEAAFKLFCTPLSRHKRPLPPVFKEAEEISIDMGVHPVHGWRWNYPSAKKLLIIHGFESAAANFDRYILPLTRKGYEVLAFDAPAHGKSAGKTITGPQYSEMIKRAHEQLGPIESYMAHSFGGLAATLALESIPHTSEYKLVLIAPATETTTAIRSFFSLLRLDEKVREAFEKIILKNGGMPSSWYSIHRAMKNIKAKVCWFHDEDDKTTPLDDALQVKKENYPNVEFVITNGLGHRRIYRENKVTKAIIDFF